MNNSNLIIYKHQTLYKILAELDQDLNFQITEINNEKFLDQEIKKFDNSIVITKKKISNISHQMIIDQYPIKV